MALSPGWAWAEGHVLSLFHRPVAGQSLRWSSKYILCTCQKNVCVVISCPFPFYTDHTFHLPCVFFFHDLGNLSILVHGKLPPFLNGSIVSCLLN